MSKDQSQHRRERLAGALRENLRKRKARTRAVEAGQKTAELSRAQPAGASEPVDPAHNPFHN